MNKFQAVSRTVIMLGTLVVGILAWQVYGPPPEKLAPLLNRAVEMANKSLGREPEPPSPETLPPPQLMPMDDSVAKPLTPAAQLRVDGEVAPASYASETTHPPAANNTEALLLHLRSLGALEPELKTWGSSGNSYRCQCRAANPANPTLERHFDAIDDDPQGAVEQVIAQMERWRSELPRN
jgi:hypothetical protein